MKNKQEFIDALDVLIKEYDVDKATRVPSHVLADFIDEVIQGVYYMVDDIKVLKDLKEENDGKM